MINKLQEVTNQIQTTEKGLQSIIDEVNSIESARLNEIVNIALKGMKFFKITSKEAEYSQNGNQYYNPRYEYFEGIKGVFITTNNNDDNYGTGTKVNREELWLLSDGTFMETHRTGDWSRYQGSWSEDEREIVEHNINICESKWVDEIDYIIKQIMITLEKRLEDLGERTQSQIKRLEKLQTLRIKE